MGQQSRAKRERRIQAEYNVSLTTCEGSWLERRPDAEEERRLREANRLLQGQREVAREFHRDNEAANLFSLELFRDEEFTPLHFDDWVIEKMIEAVGEPPLVGEEGSEADFSDYLRRAVLSVATPQLRKAMGAQLRRFLPRYVEEGRWKEAVAIDYNAHWTIFGNITTPFLVQMTLAGLARYYETAEEEE